MKWLLLAVGLLIFAVAMVAVIGACLPRSHVASRAATYRRKPAEIFTLIRDFEGAPTWRTGLKSTELLPPRDGHICYRETSSHGAITYVMREEKSAERLVTEIADENLPFGGTWTFELTSTGDGTSLRITERGEVKNVIFRCLARFVFGYTGTMETYLRDLGKKLGEETAVQP